MKMDWKKDNLVHIANSLRAYYHLPLFHKSDEQLDQSLQERKPEQIIVLLIDGLGKYQIEQLAKAKGHLANLPIYFEYQADGIGSTDAIKGTYLDNYKTMFDLYINNSTCAPTELAGKTGDDSRNEFLDNEAVFYQNGSWEYTNLVGDGKPFTDDDLTMIPVYIGVGDEANQGLCTGTENYWCVNKEADQADIDATLDFMYWCVSSDEGTKAMANDMGFVIPFKNAQESPNLFVKVDNALTAEGKTPVAWCFSTMPSENWKNGVGSALTAYAAGTGDWNAVVTAFVDGWKTEAALNAG